MGRLELRERLVLRVLKALRVLRGLLVHKVKPEMTALRDLVGRKVRPEMTVRLALKDPPETTALLCCGAFYAR